MPAADPLLVPRGIAVVPHQPMHSCLAVPPSALAIPPPAAVDLAAPVREIPARRRAAALLGTRGRLALCGRGR